MALSADANLDYAISGINQLPVKASAVIYKNSAVGLTAGYARALVANDRFGGFALEAQTGGSADGAVYVNVQNEGLILLTFSAVAVTDIGAAVYASADGTFVLTATGNTLIGRVHRYVSSTTAWVSFKSDTTA
jgi:hypothetical protein